MAAQRLQFEHFEISTDELGSPIRLGPGGMGTTFKAYDTRLRKFVALKIINERLLADASSRRRFFNEARAAALIDHPNVARVLYLCPENADECFFAMELVEGESLAARVTRCGRLPAGEALLLLRAVADALTALGEHRLVHRDIKPDNIMIARAGRNAARVKLIDFGLAKALEHAPGRFDSVHTGEHFVGTVYFASPEQIQADRALDCRSDFYSLGATLWHILTGSPPFDSKSFGHVVADQINKEPPWEKIAQFPDPIDTLLRRLLGKDPAQRPVNAEALLGEWDLAIGGIEALRLTTTPPLPQSPTAPPPDEANAANAPQAAPLVAVAVEQAPPGCAVPAPPGQLARDAASGEWLVVRVVPEGFEPELRADFLAAARAAATAPLAGLLNVREVRAAEVISQWTPGVAATQLLARQHGALPVSVIIDWLPKIAETVDWARSHGMARIGLAPARWLVSFAALAADERPIDHAALPPDSWGGHFLHLDPLAGFDAELASAASRSGDTDISARPPPLLTPAHFLAALARAIYELLGGRSQDRITPLPALEERTNDILRDAIAGRSEFASAHDLAAAFLESCREERAAAVRARDRQPPPWEERAAPLPPRESATPAPPESVGTSPSQQHPRLPRQPVALALVLLIAGLAGWWFGIEHPRREQQRGKTAEADQRALQQAAEITRQAKEAEDQRVAAQAENERKVTEAAKSTQIASALRDAAAALNAKYFALARESYQAALALDPTNAEATTGLANVKQAEEAEQARLTAESKNAEEERTRQEIEARKKMDLAKASKESPFENSLGMKFVPVPGTNVLFSVWDTRVRDFRAYAEATDYHQRDGISVMKPVKKTGGYDTVWQVDRDASWENPGFPQSAEHPVVGVSWGEAKAFCAWLTEQERKAGRIGSEQEYRLPTDAEWSTAAGDGEYPWGNQWPPPPGAGNYFDQAATKELPKSEWKQIPTNDGFARTSPVGSFKANRLGLYDMGGNVWQWCEDWYRKEMNKVAAKDLPSLNRDGGGQKYRVMRGGGWRDGTPGNLRSARHEYDSPADRSGILGFRCVLAASQPQNAASPAPTDPLPQAGQEPSARSTQDASTSEVRDFILAHEKREQDREMAAILADFAPQVDYLSSGKVSHDTIRKDIEAYFKRWPTSRDTIVGELKVRSIGDARFKATFPTTFSVENEKGDWIRGEAQITYEVVATPTGFQIVYERSEVTRRDRGNRSVQNNAHAKVPARKAR